jgi:hypothetical protein
MTCGVTECEALAAGLPVLRPAVAVAAGQVHARAAVLPHPGGRALHSSTVPLNVSAFRGIGGAFEGWLGGVEEVSGVIWGCLG